MRHPHKAIADKAGLEEVLRQGQMLHLSMCDGDEPYLVTVNYGYRDGAVYFHGARVGRKIQTLQRNPNVCFQVVAEAALVCPKEANRACGFSMRFRSVVGFGRAEILEDREEALLGLDAIMEHYVDGPWEYLEESLRRTAVVRIRVDSMTGKQSWLDQKPVGA